MRIEQLAPFPFDLVCRELRRYPNAQFVWCQEEPMNMGAYTHVQPRFDTCLRHEGKPMLGRCVWGAAGARVVHLVVLGVSGMSLFGV